MKTLFKNAFIFIEGGLLYSYIEVCFKNCTGHNEGISWTMGIVGGLVFLITGLINKIFTPEMPLYLQDIIGAVACTILEFISGLVLNKLFRLNIWDYSDLPGNILGQICPQFFLIWILLALIAIFLDDIIRWKFLNEESPHYHLFRWGKKGDKKKIFMI